MKYGFNRVTIGSLRSLLGVLSGLALMACSSADPEADSSRATAALVCGGTVTGSYGTPASYYTYPPQSLQVDCAAYGANVNVYLSANDVPNKFTILDASNNSVAISEWLGNASYSGPWGNTLSTPGSAAVSFSNSNPPYSVRVETLTPPTSFGAMTDVWSAGVACQCEAPQPVLRHYVCGYAMNRPGYNCNNGRNHVDITAVDMTAAIAICQATRLPGYPDFCVVRDLDGTSSTDASQCAAAPAPASWRPKNSCCNFKGTLSCPL